jgi:NAD(P)-dependent dehydrogenase (short-subunit alcohol dehydrogenase family)
MWKNPESRWQSAFKETKHKRGALMQQQKTALVTGGSSGIGQGISLVLAEEGYDVAITYGENAEGAQKTRQDIEALGRKCFVYQAHMQEAEVPERTVKRAIRDLGHLDLLVNNAGRSPFKPLLLSTAADMDYLYGLNYRGYLLAAGAAGRHMAANGIKGCIIFITSSRAERAYPYDCLYGGLKAALKRSCESLALELSPFGIRVNCVAPGATQVRKEWDGKKDDFARRIPAGRLGTPRENGHLVAFLASEKAGYITGVTVRVDGGLILPGMPEWDFGRASGMGWSRPELNEELMEAIRKRDDECGGEDNG